MWVAIVIFGVVLAVVVLGVCRLLAPQGPRYGYVRNKRVRPGTVYRSAASIAMNSAPMPITPDRYQLLLEREGQELNWVDVTPEQYEKAVIGKVWHPDA